MLFRLLLLLTLLFSLGGCSVLRAAAAKERSRQPIFHPPDSTLIASSTSSLGGVQNFSLTLHTSADVDATAEWFLQKFKTRGWDVTPSAPADTHTRRSLDFFHEEKAPPLPSPVVEKVQVAIHPAATPQGETTEVQINFEGYYWWGWGSPIARTIVILPFIWMGEGVEIIEVNLWWLYGFF